MLLSAPCVARRMGDGRFATPWAILSFHRFLGSISVTGKDGATSCEKAQTFAMTVLWGGWIPVAFVEGVAAGTDPGGGAPSPIAP